MRSQPPVISFLSDFGLDGAAAICRGVMLSICPTAQIVDVAHTVRKFSMADGAFILTMSLPWMPIGVHLAVVDPGVGTERRPVALMVGRGDVLVGPDNGLLIGAGKALGGIVAARELTNRELWLPETSATFHGRDVFAPVAAHLAAGDASFDEVGDLLAIDELVTLEEIEPSVSDGSLETQVIYVDSFGNLRLAGGSEHLDQALTASDLGGGLRLEALDKRGASGSHPVRFARTFGGADPGTLLLYVDSSGHLAIGVNQGNAASRLGLATGERVRIRRS
jgi:S-adenosylmethionine hydrolase